MKILMLVAFWVYAVFIGLVLVCFALAAVRTVWQQIARLRAFRLRPGNLSPWCEWCEEEFCQVSMDGRCNQIRRYQQAVLTAINRETEGCDDMINEKDEARR